MLSVRVAGLLNRFGPGALVVAAFTSLVAGYAVFLRAGVTPDYPAVMLPSVILLGAAFGFGFSALTVAATSGVRNEQQGLAASLFQTSFQVGGAVVLAVVTAVIDAAGANTLTSPAATLSAYRPALYLHHRRGGTRPDRRASGPAARHQPGPRRGDRVSGGRRTRGGGGPGRRPVAREAAGGRGVDRGAAGRP